MRKILLTFLFTVLSAVAFGQAPYLWKTVSEVKSELNKHIEEITDFKISHEGYKGNAYTIQTSLFKRPHMDFLFNSKNICIAILLYPHETLELKLLFYCNDYVVISPEHWKAHLTRGTVNIYLKPTMKEWQEYYGKYYFIWEVAPNR